MVHSTTLKAPSASLLQLKLSPLSLFWLAGLLQDHKASRELHQFSADNVEQVLGLEVQDQALMEEKQISSAAVTQMAQMVQTFRLFAGSDLAGHNPDVQETVRQENNRNSTSKELLLLERLLLLEGICNLQLSQAAAHGLLVQLQDAVIRFFHAGDDMTMVTI